MVQQLGLCVSIAEDLGDLIPDQGTKILKAPQLGQDEKRKERASDDCRPSVQDFLSPQEFLPEFRVLLIQ